MGGLRRQDHVYGDNIATGNQLVKGDKFHLRILRLDGVAHIGVAGDDLGAKALVEDVVEVTARQAEAVQAQRQLAHIRREQVLALGPVALADLPVIVGGVADEAHNHGGGHVGQLLGAKARQIQDDHTQLRGGVQVNAVDACAKALHKLHLGQGL